jgi:hypothetical protein
MAAGQMGAWLAWEEKRDAAPFATAISVGQIFDIGDPRVRANPAHFELFVWGVKLADIERLTREEV